MTATQQALLKAHRHFVESADGLITKREEVASLLEALMFDSDFPNPVQRAMVELLRLEARFLTVYTAMVEQQVAAIRDEEEENGR